MNRAVQNFERLTRGLLERHRRPKKKKYTKKQYKAFKRGIGVGIGIEEKKLIPRLRENTEKIRTQETRRFLHHAKVAKAIRENLEKKKAKKVLHLANVKQALRENVERKKHKRVLKPVLAELKRKLMKKEKKKHKRRLRPVLAELGRPRRTAEIGVQTEGPAVVEPQIPTYNGRQYPILLRGRNPNSYNSSELVGLLKAIERDNGSKLYWNWNSAANPRYQPVNNLVKDTLVAVLQEYDLLDVTRGYPKYRKRDHQNKSLIKI